MQRALQLTRHRQPDTTGTTDQYAQVALQWKPALASPAAFPGRGGAVAGALVVLEAALCLLDARFRVLARVALRDVRVFRWTGRVMVVETDTMQFVVGGAQSKTAFTTIHNAIAPKMGVPPPDIRPVSGGLALFALLVRRAHTHTLGTPAPQRVRDGLR